VPEPEGIGLAEAIEELRSELRLAHDNAAGQDVQFPIQTVTVQLQAGVTKSKEGKAGFTVPVVGAELGGSMGFNRETTQTITLVLGPPVDRHGRSVKVGERTNEQLDN
jgi:Trypsin-co-occurring domain 2